RTQPEPWSWVATKYEVGQLVLGTVTQLANFGAFARIEDGIEGLVHVSELSDARVEHPRQLVHEGQELILRIIRIDPQRRRMGLSLRRALEATDEEVAMALGPEYVELKHKLAAMELAPEGGEAASPDDDEEREAADDETLPEAEDESGAVATAEDASEASDAAPEEPEAEADGDDADEEATAS